MSGYSMRKLKKTISHASFLPSKVCIGLILIISTATAQANQKPLYRYTQESGNVVISDTIPPEYTSQGYEVIDSRGNVLKTIPKELSQAEKAQQIADRKELERLAEWDKELLARYSRVSDIESRKKRRLTGIENSIESLKLTLEKISNTISYDQAEAAADERQGEVVAKETVESIARLQKDKSFISNEIARKEKERDRANASFDKDIERFNIIKPEPKTSLNK